VLLRLVDDVLVITPSRATAEALALRQLQGARSRPHEPCTACGAPGVALLAVAPFGFSRLAWGHSTLRASRCA